MLYLLTLLANLSLKLEEPLSNMREDAKNKRFFKMLKNILFVSCHVLLFLLPQII